MDSLPDRGAWVVAALIRAARAWQTPAELAAALRQDVEDISDVVADLDVAGWVNIWEADLDEGPVATLSAAAASRLGLRLIETGFDEVPRWAEAGEPEPPTLRARHVARLARAAALDAFPDPAPPPDIAAERAEAAAKASPGADPDALPRPTLLIGQGLTPWPGPGLPLDRAAPCPACHGRPLGPAMYCLRCDRWGLDPARRSATPPGSCCVPVPRPGRAAEDGSPVDAERSATAARARRKDRRRSKLDAREHAQAAAQVARRRPDAPGGPARRFAPSAGGFNAPPRRPGLGASSP